MLLPKVRQRSHGDVLRYGQKDGRGNGTINRYAIVLEDGSRLKVSEPNASRYYHAADKVSVLSDLIAKHQAALNAQIEYDNWCDAQREAGGNWTGTPEYNRRNSILRDALKEFA